MDYIHRFVDEALDGLMAEFPALMLTGPRGCGKTTTALRRSASALRLDKPDQAAAFRAAPDVILAAQEPPVLIDEWQVVPESMGAVKRAVDAQPIPGRFLITGSVRARQSSAGWPATGRVTPLAMYGLTIAEVDGRASRASTVITRFFGSEDPAIGELDDAPDLGAYVDYAVRGGFPSAIGLSEAARAVWYEGYIDQLVRHDVHEAADVRSPTALTALIKAVAVNQAGTPTVETLRQAVGLDHRTVSGYLGLLESLGVIERLPAWETNRLNRLIKAPKYYVLDPGMAANLAGDDRAGLLRSGDRLGRMMDALVMAQLRPVLRLGDPAVRAFHLRDANGSREIDLVLESAAGRIVGIEIKAGSAVTAGSARHLAWLRDQVGTHFVRGVVLHSGSMTYPLGDRLWAMPVAAIWR